MVEGRKTYIDQSLEVAREANAQLSKLKEESEALIAAANKEQGRILRENRTWQAPQTPHRMKGASRTADHYRVITMT